VTGTQEESKFSRLAQEEGVMKKLYCGQITVICFLHTMYYKDAHVWRQGTTPWNYCKSTSGSIQLSCCCTFVLLF